MFKNSQKGVSLYLSLIIMFILIAIGLGVSLIIVSQMKMIRGMGDSVVAFYAADTGIERALYEKRVAGATEDFTIPDTVGNASYTVNYTQATGVAQSFGTFKGVKRAIEITHLIVFDFSLAYFPTPEFNVDVDLLPMSESTTLSTTLISGADQSLDFFVDNCVDSSGDPCPAWLTYNFPSGNSCPLVTGCNLTLEFTVEAGAPVGYNDALDATVRAQADVGYKTTHVIIYVQTL